MNEQVNLPDDSLRISVECHTEPGTFHFEVSPQLGIGQFLEQVLDRLEQGKNADRVRNMRNYYEPVLELCADTSMLPLDSTLTLKQAGVKDDAVCRIAAKPRKERIMFCNNG